MGKKLSFGLGPRGEMYSFSLDLDRSDIASVRRLSRMFKEGLRSMSCRVPPDELGVGAKWKNIEPWTYEESTPWLHHLDNEWIGENEDAIVVRAALSSSFKVEAPKLPTEPGRSVVESASSSGTVKYTFPQTTALPEEVEVRETIEWKYKVMEHRSRQLVPGKDVVNQSTRISIKAEVPTKRKQTPPQ